MFSINMRKGLLEAFCRFPWNLSLVVFMANPRVTSGDPASVKETFESLVEDGIFRMFEVNLIDDNSWKIASHLIETANVEVAVGLQPLVLSQGVNLCSLKEEERKKSVEFISKAIHVSFKRGARKVALCSGQDPGTENREAAKDALVKSLNELTAEASKLGVTLILETFDREWDRKQLIGPLHDAVEVAFEVKEFHENFGLLWDLSHAPMLNEKPADLKIARDYLSHIHIGCAKRLPDGRLVDTHPGFYRPGSVNGVEEVADLLRVLLEIDYSGYVGFEIKPEDGQTWREPLEAAKGVLLTAFARCVR